MAEMWTNRVHPSPTWRQLGARGRPAISRAACISPDFVLVIAGDDHKHTFTPPNTHLHPSLEDIEPNLVMDVKRRKKFTWRHLEHGVSGQDFVRLAHAGSARVGGPLLVRPVRCLACRGFECVAGLVPSASWEG